MLSFVENVLELFERLRHIAWHGEMYLLFLVVPVQRNANVPFSSPISGDFVVFFECLFEAEGMFFAFILDTKIVHD